MYLRSVSPSIKKTDLSYRLAIILGASALLSACATFGGAGPTANSIKRQSAQKNANSAVTLVQLDSNALVRIRNFEKALGFLEVFGESTVEDPIIGPGDVLDVTIWEAPPAVLFGAIGQGGVPALEGSGAQNRTVLQQIVSAGGHLNIPFVGVLSVRGKAPDIIEREIVKRLRGRSNDPQAIVRLAQNDARNVTVLGEVASSRRIPLGPRGERLLDILAAAGGSRQPVGQTTVQLTRGGVSATMPLDAVIADQRHNIRLRSDDVLTVMHQPFTFTALGAVARNAEIPFEGKGITLAQALGRVGGLRDDRADIRGIFIFRLELPDVLDPLITSAAQRTANGRIPVIYRLELDDPSGFFLAQDFTLRDKDVVYVSNAPGADFTRFLNTVSSLAFTVISAGNAVNK